MEGCSERIGGPNKTVEIDESTFGRRKYHRGHPVKGQWVSDGVERESGRSFFVPVLGRTAYILTNVIRDWIEPGTTLISDCWAAYRVSRLHAPHRESLDLVHSSGHRGSHKYHREYVASRGGLPSTIQPPGGLRIPSRSLHVCGEVQGTGDFSIPCHRRSHRLVLLHHRHLAVRRHVTSSCSSPDTTASR